MTEPTDTGEHEGAAVAAAIRTRSASLARSRVDDVRRNLRTLIQAGVAAGLAFFIAKEVVGHPQPFFAPVAAVLTLSLTVGRRGRRAVEVAVGVALGIAIADLLVLAIGTGPWQIGLVVALAMGAAILLGGGTTLVNQAAVSAVLVATLQLPTSGISGARFIDALVGGAVALLVSAIAPTNPVELIRRELIPLLEELAATLDDVASALAGGDSEAAQRALDRGRAIDPRVVRLREAVETGEEMMVMAPSRRKERGRLVQFSTALEPVDHAVRNTRVLARGSIRAVELDEKVPPRAITAIGHLAEAVRALDSYLDDPAGPDPARDAARRAAAESTAALEETANLAVAVIVGQIRSTATDILRGLGDDTQEARIAVRMASPDSP